jgi:hypothetical protein
VSEPEKISSSLDGEASLRSAAIATNSIASQRLEFLRYIGLTFSGKRDTWNVLGYPRKILPEEYPEAYRRGGVAARVVNILPKATWRGEGELVEDENPDISTEFERVFDRLNQRLKIWPTFQRLDILAAQGRYAVLLIGAKGSSILSEELKPGRPESLLYLTPFKETDASVQTWVTDIQSPRFGLPETYQLKQVDVTSPELQKPVHWSRIVHVPSEGFLDNEVYGPPALESVWNYLLDLDKVVGGGAEAFWLRANQGLHLDIAKDMDLPNTSDAIAALKEQAEDYKHQLTRWLRTRGVEAKVLGSDVADFKNPADVLMTLIAGTRGIPKRILFGSEMGELASSQDRTNWQDQIADRRTSYASPVIVRATIDRLIQYRFLPEPKQYDVQWASVANFSEMERIDAAKKAASLNDHGQIVITASEIRDKFLSMEPLDEADLPEEDEQVAKLEAALRKGGAINLVVKGNAD